MKVDYVLLVVLSFPVSKDHWFIRRPFVRRVGRHFALSITHRLTHINLRIQQYFCGLGYTQIIDGNRY